MASNLLLFPLPDAPFPRPAAQPVMALSDSEAREAALDIQGSWIVEAPAGSGKTGLLIQRFLKLLAYADIQRPAEVLVLTFTRKADGELRRRIYDQLTAADRGVPLPSTAGAFERSTRALAEAVLVRDRERHWRLLQSPSQLHLRTIDAFCADLARSMPLLAGGGQFVPVDDPFPLYQLAAERTIGQLGGSDRILSEALRLLLQHRDAQVPDCVRLLVEMLAQREQWSELIPLNKATLTDEFLDAEVRNRLDRTLLRLVEEGLRRAADALGEQDLAEISSFASRLSHCGGYKGAENTFGIFTSLQGVLPTTGEFLPHWKKIADLLLTGKGEWRKRPQASHIKCDLDELDGNWLRDFLLHLGGRVQDCREALQAVRGLPPAEYPEEAWPLIKALCRILSHALAELRGVFAGRGQCDFTEIALAARSLLQPERNAAPSAAPDPASTAAGSLSHLLVDEMQDTSSGQYALLETLTQFWDGASQTVFLVGDPKQSIYAFRQARVERFLRTMATGRLGDLPLSPLRLTANFRSQATLVASFNKTFAEIFSGESAASGGTEEEAAEAALDKASPVPFVAASATREAAAGKSFHWHFSYGGRHGTGDGQGDAVQARAIREQIESFRTAWPERMRAQGLRKQLPTIAVLARNRSHLAAVIREFKMDRGQGVVPFRAVDVEALGERPEILDLLALTRALLHPADRVAWLAVLRSPFCGLTLTDLLRLTGGGTGSERRSTILSLVETQRQNLSSEGQQLLGRIWPTLLRALQEIGAMEMSQLVERTWRSLGGDAPLNADQRRNAYRFFDLLRELEGAGAVLSLASLKRGLQRLYAEQAPTEGAVELMTIHKAKGLEWDLVLIPSLDRGSGQNAHGLLKWLEVDNPERDADLLLAPIQSKGFESSPLSRWLNHGVQRREAAEAQRLFYVACTRAREELHLFAALQTKVDGSLSAPIAASSLLRAAWPAAERAVGSDDANSPGTLLVLPALQKPEPLALAAAADSEEQASDGRERSKVPRIQRLPMGLDPAARFQALARPLLPYPSAEALRREALFARPEGSFAARAFGNTLHRFLEQVALRLDAGELIASVQEQTVGWSTRLSAALRNEGLPANQALAEAQRASEALAAALRHPEGAWVLSPHAAARTEANLDRSSGVGALRADRTFLAGPTPLDSSNATHLWIVDYKTVDPGGRDRNDFLAEQKRKYLAQMEAYAAAAERAGTMRDRIVLALYFPMLPELVFWTPTASSTAHTSESRPR